MLGFFLGAGAIVTPQIGIPVAAGFAGVKGIKSLLKKQNQERSSANVDAKTVEESYKLFEHAVPPVALEWSAVNCTLKTKSGKDKHILTDVSGIAKPGRLTAIMGPSGSGKTSLLNTLAGQVALNPAMDLSGCVTVNGHPSSSSNHKQAYVQQEDVFYSMLTTAETLEMASQLRLPPSMSAEQRTAYVDHLVAMLGLAKGLDTRVGDKKARGLSGGEKKRLSIGCELIGSPSLLFLDEPTTGLDAFAAQRVVSTLKSLASAGHTVVASIHQPRSSIFAMFDDLVLLSEGELLYCGPAQEALAHFAAQGHRCPAGFSPADFLADLISVDYSSHEAEQASRTRVQALREAWRRTEQQRRSHVHQSPSQDLSLVTANVAPRVGWLRQLRLLAVRSWRQVSRDKATNISRAMANISSALIFGAIFFRIKRSQSSIQDRLGLLQVAAINTAMSSLVKTLSVFPRERVIMTRERAKNSYATAPYLAAKLLAELPIGAVFPLLFGAITYPLCGLHPRPSRLLTYLGILTLESFTSSAMGLAVGAMAPSTEAASAIGPAVMVVWIVFGGYYVNQGNVPRVLRWLPSASLIKQGFQALCINEFPGLTFEPDTSGRGMMNGDDVLSWLSFDQSSVGKCLAQQARVLAFYYWATYCILQSRRNTFMTVKPPVALEMASLEASGVEAASVNTASQVAPKGAAKDVAVGDGDVTLYTN